jgi:hypothetical protein
LGLRHTFTLLPPSPSHKNLTVNICAISKKKFPANKTLKFSYFLRLADRTIERGQQRQKQRRNIEENS